MTTKGYTQDQVEEFKRELCLVDDGEASTLDRRTMAMVRLGYALCSDMLNDAQKWQVTQTLVTRCFGQEPDEDMRIGLADIIGVLALSGHLKPQQGKALILQMAQHVQNAPVSEAPVTAKLSNWLNDIGRIGLTEIYGDNALSVSSSPQRVLPLQAFSFSYGLPN